MDVCHLWTTADTHYAKCHGLPSSNAKKDAQSNTSAFRIPLANHFSATRCNSAPRQLYFILFPSEQGIYIGGDGRASVKT